MIPYDSGDLQYASAHTVAPAPPVSLEFIEAAEVLMMENNLEFPLTVEEAYIFYLNLNDIFHTIL